MKFPSVYPLTIPSSQRMIKRIAIVSNMGRLLCAVAGACTPRRSSNGCATSSSQPLRATLRVAALALVAIFITAELARAQDAAQQPASSDEHPASSFAKFIGGGAVGLAAHESGHLLFDAIFDAHAGVQKVSFHGIPFFAITHDPNISPREEFVIDSAGFWVQHLGSEIMLSHRPNLRYEHAPFQKGILAFNVLASVAYASAAFARTGPVERDTRGMADALRWKEPWVGAMILVPALLDTVRYFRPDAKWAVWGSRGAKVGMVLLVVRPYGS